MNSSFFAASIQDSIGGNIQIELWRKTISLEQRGLIPKDQRVQAIHTEVPYAMKDAGTKALLELYRHSTRNVFSHDVKARFVLPTQYIRNPHTTIKIDRLCSRQQMFKKRVSSAEIGSISNLDFSAGLEGKTLRTIIMGIEYSTIPNHNYLLILINIGQEMDTHCISSLNMNNRHDWWLQTSSHT